MNAPLPGLLPQRATDETRRIAILVGSLAAGGAERVAVTMANAWRERGNDVWLIATYLGTCESAYPLDAGVFRVLLAESLTAPGVIRYPVTLRKLRALRQLLAGIKPDVIISFLTNVNVLAIAARGFSGVPLIVSERTDPLNDRALPRVLRAVRALCYPFADAVVIQSETAARRYGASLRGIARVAVIPNPLPARLQSSTVRASHEGVGGCVVAMGRLAPEKGFARLIEAFASAFQGSPWQLRIWGEGPLRGELENFVAARQLTERVRLCGPTARPWDALAEGQIFALSSEYEGFPNAMLEAMALGLACVAFDCPSGPRELADGGRAAVLVPAGDVAMLASALRELGGDPGRRRALGAHAAAFVRRQFTEASVMANWDALIGELMERRPAARSSGS